MVKKKSKIDLKNPLAGPFTPPPGFDVNNLPAPPRTIPRGGGVPPEFRGINFTPPPGFKISSLPAPPGTKTTATTEKPKLKLSSASQFVKDNLRIAQENRSKEDQNIDKNKARQGITDQTSSDQITVEEARAAEDTIGQGISDLDQTFSQDTTPTPGQEAGQVLGSGVDVLVPLTIQGLSIALAPVSFGASALIGGVLASTVGGVLVSSERQKVKEANAVVSGAQQNISDTIALARSGQLPPEAAILALQQSFQAINKAERALKILMSNPISAKASGASDELASITAYRDNYNNLRLTMISALQEGASTRLGAGQNI